MPAGLVGLISPGSFVLALIATEGADGVAAISIRNLDEWVVERIRVRAAEHGHSMEAEVRSILVDAAREPGTEYGLGDQIHGAPLRSNTYMAFPSL